MLVAVEMLVHEVGLKLLHCLPSLVKHLALRVGTRCADKLDVGIFGLDSLDERTQTLVVEVVPLLVAHCKELEVERCRVSHLGALLTPCGVDVAVGKLDKVETILYIRLQILNGYVCRRVVGVLELASHTYVEHRQRLGANVLRQEEVLVEAQSVALIIIGEETIVEC